MPYFPDKRPTYQTKGQMAYEALKEAIVSGALRPGQRLALNRVAEELGISEIPVREAVQRLEGEGLVVRENGVFRVAPISKEELEENYVIRSHLELLAVRTAVPHVTPEVLAQLWDLVDQMQACVDQGRYQEYGALNNRFHALLYAQSPYPTLRRLIEDFWARAQRTRIVFLAFRETAAVSNQEHRELLRCIERGDVEGAEQVIRGHTARTLRALRAVLAQEDLEGGHDP